MRNGSIIFNGDEIVARYVVGQTRYLLITFIGAVHESEAETHYLLSDFVEDNNVSCIGVSTKSRGFYLGSEMQEVLRLINEIRAGFSQVIVIGLSMGGYAAIKYSAALKADHVVGFSPLYSIDLEELAFTDPKMVVVREVAMAENAIVPRPEFKGMAPKPDDVSGSIFVVYDTKNEIDRHSAELLSARLPGVTAIPLTLVGHLTHLSYFDEIVMFKLIDVLLTGKPIDVRRVFLSVARRKASYAIEILRAAARRRPRMAARTIHSPRLSDSAIQDAMRESDLAGQLMYTFALRGDRAGVRDVLQWAVKERRFMAADVDPDRAAPSAKLLLTYHGRLLFFDKVTRKLSQKTGMNARTSLRPVGLTLREDGVLTAAYISNGLEVEIDLDPATGGPYAFETVPETGLLAISARAQDGSRRYLSADSNGRVGLTATEVFGWEQFVALDVDRSFLAQENASIDGWLDKALARVAKPAPVNADRMPKKTQTAVGRFWSGLARGHAS